MSLLFAFAPVAAADKQQAVRAEQQTGSAVGKNAPAVRRAGGSEARKSYPAVDLIDINSASPSELKKLPGIDDATANRIVANRPYGTKAWLVTQQIVPAGTFQSIRHRIIAKQPFKNAAEIEAAYRGKK